MTHPPLDPWNPSADGLCEVCWPTEAWRGEQRACSHLGPAPLAPPHPRGAQSLRGTEAGGRLCPDGRTLWSRQHQMGARAGEGRGAGLTWGPGCPGGPSRPGTPGRPAGPGMSELFIPKRPGSPGRPGTPGGPGGPGKPLGPWTWENRMATGCGTPWGQHPPGSGITATPRGPHVHGGGRAAATWAEGHSLGGSAGHCRTRTPPCR